MRVLADGRVRRSADEWKEIIERHRESHLSIEAFCATEQLSRSAFAKWKRRLSGGPKKRPAFVELARPTMKAPELPIVLGETSFELALPGGVTLRWKG